MPEDFANRFAALPELNEGLKRRLVEVNLQQANFCYLLRFIVISSIPINEHAQKTGTKKTKIHCEPHEGGESIKQSLITRLPAESACEGLIKVMSLQTAFHLLRYTFYFTD